MSLSLFSRGSRSTSSPKSNSNGAYDSGGDGLEILQEWLKAEVQVRLIEVEAKLDTLTVLTQQRLATSIVSHHDNPVQEYRCSVQSAVGKAVSKNRKASISYESETFHIGAEVVHHDSENSGVKESTPLLSERESEQERAQFRELFVHRRDHKHDIFHYHSESTRKVTTFLEDPDSSVKAKMYDRCMEAFIAFSIVVSLARTTDLVLMQSLPAVMLEVFIDIVFSLEVLIRFTFCPNYGVFVRSAYNMIDTVSLIILSLRVETFYGLQDSLFEESLSCVMPTFRFLKLLRRYRQFHILIAAFHEAFLALPVLLYTLFLMILLFSSTFYLFEPRENIPNYPVALWVVVCTVTTVGYSDTLPSTDGGRIMCSLLMMISMLYMAMPIGMIGQSFNAMWNDRERILLLRLVRERLVQWEFEPEDMHKLFVYFDLDSSGEIDIKEFRHMMSEMQLGLEPDSVTELFQCVDVDCSGAIDDAEFVRALFPREFADIYDKAHARRKLNQERTSVRLSSRLSCIPGHIPMGRIESIRNS